MCSFIDASPSPFHAVAAVVERLEAARFTRLREADAWPADAARGRRYVVRDGSLVAWATDDPVDGWRIVGAHTDSPNLRIKPRPDTGRAGARQLAVEPYGGVLLNSWLGRDLGLSGRVALRDGSLHLLRVDDPVLHLPQLAIHLDREVDTEGLLLNPQQHLAPIWGLGAPEEGGFRRFLAERLDVDPDAVAAWDVMTHDLTPSALVGPATASCSPRPASTTSCSAWAAVDALISAGTGVVALWDHEEIGSEHPPGRRQPAARHGARAHDGQQARGAAPGPRPVRVPLGRHGPRHAPELRRAPRARALDRPGRRAGHQDQRQPALRHRRPLGRGVRGGLRPGRRRAAVVRPPRRPRLRLHHRAHHGRPPRHRRPSTSAPPCSPCTRPASSWPPPTSRPTAT